MAEVRREWEKAPPVVGLDNTQVRLTGFPVMLDDAAGPTRKFILAPYYGACIHAPTPAPNQMVVVTLNHDLPREMYQFPIWVSGTISVRPTSTRHGRVAYQMTGAKWEPYPYQKYPRPQYQLPR